MFGSKALRDEIATKRKCLFSGIKPKNSSIFTVVIPYVPLLVHTYVKIDSTGEVNAVDVNVI